MKKENKKIKKKKTCEFKGMRRGDSAHPLSKRSNCNGFSQNDLIVNSRSLKPHPSPTPTDHLRWNHISPRRFSYRWELITTGATEPAGAATGLRVKTSCSYYVFIELASISLITLSRTFITPPKLATANEILCIVSRLGRACAQEGSSTRGVQMWNLIKRFTVFFFFPTFNLLSSMIIKIPT